jgi:hypothetical protein
MGLIRNLDTFSENVLNLRADCRNYDRDFKYSWNKLLKKIQLLEYFSVPVNRPVFSASNFKVISWKWVSAIMTFHFESKPIIPTTSRYNYCRMYNIPAVFAA